MASNTGDGKASSSSSQQTHSNNSDHRPAQPSALRNTQLPPQTPRSSNSEEVRSDGIHPQDEDASAHSSKANAQAEIQEPQQAPTLRTRLLGQMKKYYGTYDSDEENSTQETTARRPRAQRGYDSYESTSSALPRGYGGPLPDDASGKDQTHDVLGDAVTDGLLGHANGHSKGTTSWLAHKNGIPRPRLMYGYLETRRDEHADERTGT